MPTEKTKADYRKLAANFYAKRLGSEQPTPKKITDALKACASEYRPAYWRRLRNALELDQREKGFDKAVELIKYTRNPMTTVAGGKGIIDPTVRGPTPPKQRRAKSLSDDDFQKLMKALTDVESEIEHANNKETMSAVLLAKHLGVRPAEMLGLKIDERGCVFVSSAKKTLDGVRGADRRLQVEPSVQLEISRAIRVLQKGEQRHPSVMRRVQSRLDRLSRRLWPRRQARPSLYTFRHQLGGNLKAMGLDRRAIAYVMGHQSTQSVEVYGDRRKGSGGVAIKLDGQEAQEFQGRVNHRPSDSARSAAVAVAPAAPVEQEVHETSSEPSSGSTNPGPGM